MIPLLKRFRAWIMISGTLCRRHRRRRRRRRQQQQQHWQLRAATP
jgi:hypothetical protein